MPGLILWKNQEIEKLRKEMDRLFNRLHSGFGIGEFPNEGEPGILVELEESEDTLTLTASLPDIDSEDLDITLRKDRLIIKGKTGKERIKDGDQGINIKRKYSFFSRMVRLPCKVEAEGTKATYSRGALKIVMPKLEPREPRKIKVRLR